MERVTIINRFIKQYFSKQNYHAEQKLEIRNLVAIFLFMYCHLSDFYTDPATSGAHMNDKIT